jgi:hypothetical protein
MGVLLRMQRGTIYAGFCRLQWAAIRFFVAGFDHFFWHGGVVFLQGVFAKAGVKTCPVSGALAVNTRWLAVD